MNIFFVRLRRFCAFLTGFVFFLSGIFKLTDPVGAGLVMSEYYKFFHIGFLDFTALPAAVILAFAETTIGAALVSGVWRKVAAFAASGFLAFFTLLTLILVIFNPEMDCGCFGEVIHLSHMQTFIKNIVLCLLCFAAFYPYKEFGRTRRRKYVAFPMVMTAVMAFTAYSLIFIPLTDYTDYKPATRLMAAERPSDAGEDMYEYVVVYEKNGQQKEFSLESLPDSTWTFVESKAVPKNGYAVEVTPELSFTDSLGNYQDDLAVRGPVLVISVYRPSTVSRVKWEEISQFADYAESSGYTPLILAAASPEQYFNILKGKGLDDSEIAGLSSRVFYSDFKTLVAMNRSNGGITFFYEGYLVRKWSYHGRPAQEELQELLSGDTTETLLDYSTYGSLTFKGFLLYCFAVLLLL